MTSYEILYIFAGALLIFAIILAIVAQVKVSSTYSKYKDVHVESGLTTEELVSKVCSGANIAVRTNVIGGTLSDFYNPADKSINISRSNYNSSSISALGVVAHELGHALQDAKGYAPMKVRSVVIKASNLTSRLLVPMILIGIVLSIFSMLAGSIVIYASVALYFISFVAGLVTLPVEFNASHRAIKMLGGLEIMNKQELAATKEVLGAAALTYVASMLVSLAYFLRFLAIILASRRD